MKRSKDITCESVLLQYLKENEGWISRTNLATRFSEDNCRPQCVGCNMFNQGRLDVFTVNLIKEGIDIVKLQQSKYQVFKIDKIWYGEKIDYYQKKLIELENDTLPSL